MICLYRKRWWADFGLIVAIAMTMGQLLGLEPVSPKQKLKNMVMSVLVIYTNLFTISDQVRKDHIALAVDNDDLKILEKLRARELT